ncbi:MAG: hypothetical protein D6712_20890 [Chloroflexi bacterium]|nr:MAG: hypothetical protein D6712_20890 [Chloroflexota bacterium]
MSTKITAFGLRDATVIKLKETDLYPEEATGTTPFWGQDIAGINSLQPNVTPHQRVTALGDDRVVFTTVIPPNENINFTVTTAIRDMNFEALISGVETATSAGDGILVAYDTDKRGDEPTVALIFRREAQDTNPNSPTKGATRWQQIIVPAAKVTPAGFTASQQEAESNSYSVTPTPVTKTLWQQSLSDGTYGANETVYQVLVTEYPVWLDFYYLSSGTTGLQLSHQPISVAKTEVWSNGTKQSVSAVNTTSNTVTTSGSVNGSVVVVYQTTSIE